MSVVLALTAACSSGESASDLDALPAASTTTPSASTQTPQDEERPVFEGTEREWLYALAECIEEGGFSVSINEEQGSLEAANLPPEQNDAWNSHSEKCSMEVGVPQVEELTEDQVRALFKDYLANAECLEGLGYEISDPPSRESWVKSWDAGLNWLPYRDISEVVDNPAEWERVNEDCPQPG